MIPNDEVVSRQQVIDAIIAYPRASGALRSLFPKVYAEMQVPRPDSGTSVEHNDFGRGIVMNPFASQGMYRAIFGDINPPSDAVSISIGEGNSHTGRWSELLADGWRVK